MRVGDAPGSMLDKEKTASSDQTLTFPMDDRLKDIRNHFACAVAKMINLYTGLTSRLG